MDDDLKARIVDYYRAHYPKNKIMMGSAIDGIIDCELGRYEQAWGGVLFGFAPAFSSTLFHRQ